MTTRSSTRMSSKRTDIDRRRLLQSAAALGAATLGGTPLFAQTRGETLLVIQELGPNSLDMQGLGSAQPVNGVALNCYDRLVRYKRVPLPGEGQGGLLPP